jgi:hypothetical protein
MLKVRPMSLIMFGSWRNADEVGRLGDPVLKER